MDTPEGPVGSAVNIAARLCAMAQPGEVLVSDTVRALTRSVGPAAFVRAGNRRITGFDEPLDVYRAVPVAPGGVVPRQGRRRRPAASRRALGAALAAAAAVAVGAAVVAGPRPGAPPASAAPGTPAGAASAASPPASATRRPPGLERATRLAVPFTIGLDPGWQRDNSERPDLVTFLRRAEPTGVIDVLIVDAVLDPPCPEVDPAFVGDRPEDVIEWLATRPWLDHDQPRPYSLGPYLGRAITIGIPARARWTCPDAASPGAATMFRLRASDPEAVGGAWTARLTQQSFVVAVDAGGRTVTLAVSTAADDPRPFWDLAIPLLESIRFEDTRR